MLLRKWTTDTPTPHVVRLEVRRFTHEITLSADGVVVHCRPAPLGISGPIACKVCGVKGTRTLV
jgi:hypothetical protein